MRALPLWARIGLYILMYILKGVYRNNPIHSLRFIALYSGHAPYSQRRARIAFESSS